MANSRFKKIKGHVAENLFRYSLFIKAFDGCVEIISGLLLTVIKADRINAIIISYAHDELTEEPHNQFAAYFLNHGHISSQTAAFTAVLLIARGVVKILVITGLLQHRIWVYPVAIIVFAAFMIFELYTYSTSHSVFLLALAIFDAFVIALTVREYRLLTAQQKR